MEGQGTTRSGQTIRLVDKEPVFLFDKPINRWYLKRTVREVTRASQGETVGKITVNGKRYAVEKVGTSEWEILDFPFVCDE